MKNFFLSEGVSSLANKWTHHSAFTTALNWVHASFNLDICWDFSLTKCTMCTMSYYKPGSAVVQRAHDPIKQDANKTCTLFFFTFWSVGLMRDQYYEFFQPDFQLFKRSGKTSWRRDVVQNNKVHNGTTETA